MHRKNYVALAGSIKEHKPNDDFVLDLMGILKRDNVKFDKTRFLEACELPHLMNKKI